MRKGKKAWVLIKKSLNIQNEYDLLGKKRHNTY